MATELVTMSTRELDRLEIVRRVKQRSLTQAKAAQLLGLSARQVRRMCAAFSKDIICANSPQAKGRVERMNQTLQDRLVKELRLRDIRTKEAGNAYLPEFMDNYNRRFARPARNPHDAHRPLRGDEDLYRIFSWQEERTLSQNLTVHYKRVTYLIERSAENLALARKRVVVREWDDGSIELHCQGRKLAYSVFDNDQVVSQGAIVENKRLGAVLSLIQVGQADRDRERLAKKGPTLRQKARIAAKRSAAGLPVAPTAPPTLVPVPSSEDRLDAMLSYLEAFDEQQRAKQKLANVKAALLRKAKLCGAPEPDLERRPMLT